MALDAEPDKDSIRNALSSGHGCLEALYYLASAPQAVVGAFVDELVSRALEGGSEMEHIQQILGRASKSELEKRLPRLVDDLVAEGDESWHKYLPMAGLLDNLGFRTLLRDLIAVTRLSRNEDIRELSTYYSDANGPE